jgi:integrase
MASLYERNGSPYFWLKFRDGHGEVQQISTKCRTDRTAEVRRARQMEAEKTLEELKHAPLRSRDGWDWVDDFFAISYKKNPNTLERYTSCWATLKIFLEHTKIHGPAQFLRKHCFDFITWRKNPKGLEGKQRAVRAACHNTALLDLKIMRIVMQEAVERNLAPGNPCLRLGIEREARKLKPELSDDDIDFIRSKIPSAENEVTRHMLTVSFEIARYQGCRISETRLHVTRDVDLNARTITFHAKGQKDFVTALHPKLIPLFEKLRADGREYTWEQGGSYRQWASLQWHKFLKRIGLPARLPNVCFHSNRVSIVTRLARNNVPISKAKAYVGHANGFIHETYQRLTAQDVAGCTDAVG